MDYYSPQEKALLQKILQSSTYKLAEADSEFLSRYEARSVRLELDYLKAELAIKEFEVKGTIVVFGSARILPQSVAKEQLEALKESGASDLEIQKAQKAVQMSSYYEDARRLGFLIGSSGKSPSDNRVVVMTGGGPGIMEAANKGAYEAGANSIGLNIKLPHEQFPNPYITPELCFEFHYFAIRKFHFFQRAKAMVVYPGGFGTMDEFFELLTLVQTKKMKHIPVIIIGKEWWQRLINFDFLVEEGTINKEDLEIFYFAKDADDAWGYIVNWYQKADKPLFNN